MSDRFLQLVASLMRAGLSKDEAELYAVLTKGPATHLQISRLTGMSRTKVYRVAERLEQQGIVIRRADDRGKFLVAGDLAFLSEEALRQQYAAKARVSALDVVSQLIPAMQADNENDFVVHTYSGIDGMRQMQWHELKTKGQLRAFGFLTYEELVGSHRWAEQFRTRVAKAGYPIRELVCRLPEDFRYTDVDEYVAHYTSRILTGVDLPVGAPIVIYNNTVAIYQVDRQNKFGIEIIHAGFAKTMAAIFDHYWQQADEQNMQAQ